MYLVLEWLMLSPGKYIPISIHNRRRIKPKVHGWLRHCRSITSDVSIQRRYLLKSTKCIKSTTSVPFLRWLFVVIYCFNATSTSASTFTWIPRVTYRFAMTSSTPTMPVAPTTQRAVEWLTLTLLV